MFDNLLSPFPFTVLQTVTFPLFIPEISFLKQVYCLKFTLVERRPIQAKTKLPSQNTATTIITTHLPAISKNPSLQGVVEVLDFQFLAPPGLFLHS